MVWALEVYDTEQREARHREYTSSAKKARLWERIPRIDFTDSGHGLVFRAVAHKGKRHNVFNWELARTADRELKRLRAEDQAKRKARAAVTYPRPRG